MNIIEPATAGVDKPEGEICLELPEELAAKGLSFMGLSASDISKLERIDSNYRDKTEVYYMFITYVNELRHQLYRLVTEGIPFSCTLKTLSNPELVIHNRYAANGDAKIQRVSEDNKGMDVEQLLSAIEVPSRPAVKVERLTKMIKAHADAVLPASWHNQVEFGRRFQMGRLVTSQTDMPEMPDFFFDLKRYPWKYRIQQP